MRWITVACVLGLGAGCSSPKADDERRETPPPAQEQTEREPTSQPAVPAAEPVPAAAPARPEDPHLAALDEALKQLEAPVGALDRAGAFAGTGREEDEARRVLIRIVNRTPGRLDVAGLSERVATHLRPIAAGASLQTWESGEEGPEEGPGAAGGDGSAPLLLLGDVTASVTVYESGERDRQVSVTLSLIDPVSEKVLAAASSGRPPAPFEAALGELRRALSERGTKGWPAGGKPRVRVGKLINKTTAREDLEGLQPWLERTLVEAGLEVAPGPRGQMAIAEAVEQDMNRRGPSWSPRGAVTGYVLQGELVEEQPGAPEAVFHLVSTASPAKVVLTARARVALEPR